MKIIKPYMRIQNVLINPLGRINWIGRISHRSEEAENQNAEKFIRAVVIGHGDWSITEHDSITVDAIVDRGITHEIVRHRIGAYTQESTRFVNYVKKMPPSFIYPMVGVDCYYCLNRGDVTEHGGRWGHWTEDNADFAPCGYAMEWLESIDKVGRSYAALVTPKAQGGYGWSPQEARSVFPNALASRIIITYNLRSWRHFFLMRTSKEAHPQMRQVTIPLLEEFKKTIPVLYEDIEPEQRQIDNMRKPR